jgi:hypothetical protein
MTYMVKSRLDQFRKFLLSFSLKIFVLTSHTKKLRIKIYKTVILPVLYGCETLSLTLRDKYTLKIFEKRLLREMFEPKREEDG